MKEKEKAPIIFHLGSVTSEKTQKAERHGPSRSQKSRWQRKGATREKPYLEKEKLQHIQFGSLPPSVLPCNMVFTLLLAFGAKTGQPQQIQGGALCLAEQPGQIVSKIEDGGDDQPKENKAGESFGKQQREQIEPVAWIKGSPMITIIQKNQDMSFLRPVSSARVLIDRPPFAMTMHLKPLYLYNRKVHLEGVPVSWVLVDGGAAVNILPWSVLNRLGKNKDDLLPTDLCIINFTGGISKTMGVFPADMTVGSKTALTAFFVVKAAASYKVLVGRDWIHAWMVVPSSLHQLLVFWNGNDAEIIWADEEPLIVKVHAQEAFLYQENVGPVRFLGQS